MERDKASTRQYNSVETLPQLYCPDWHGEGRCHETASIPFSIKYIYKNCSQNIVFFVHNLKRTCYPESIKQSHSQSMERIARSKLTVLNIKNSQIRSYRSETIKVNIQQQLPSVHLADPSRPKIIYSCHNYTEVHQQ